MTETVQISSNPTFAWTDLLHVLRRQGYRAAFVSGDIESATFRIDGTTPPLGEGVLAALDDLIQDSGKALLSRQLDPGHYVVHPAAG